MSSILSENEIVHYEVLGRGRPLFFLHTWTGSWRYWIPTMQATSISFRSYALDFWGYGDSAKATARYDIDHQVRLVRYMLDVFGIDKVALIGHGLGAIVAMIYAYRYPKAVDRVLAISYPLIEQGINNRLKSDSPSKSAGWLATQPPHDTILQSEAQKIDLQAIRTSLQSLKYIDLSALVLEIATPSLLLYGLHDPAIAVPDQDQLSHLPEHSTHMVFDQSGHYPMDDEPNRFRRLLGDFLALPSGESVRSLMSKEEWKISPTEPITHAEPRIKEQDTIQGVSQHREIGTEERKVISQPRGQLDQPVEIGYPDINPEFDDVAKSIPSRMLQISFERFQNQPALIFTLYQFKDGWVGKTFEPVLLENDPANFASRQYERLTMLRDRVDPTSKSILGRQRILPANDIDRHIKNFGENLWRDLIPEKLKDIYQDDRLAWHGQTLLIVSDEPYFPWELVWPYGGDWEDTGPWCETILLTRWLRRDYKGNGNDAPPRGLHIQSLVCIALGSGLRYAQEEMDFIAQIASAKNLKLITPLPPSWANVLKVLEGGEYEWLHAATHGDFYPEDPEADSAIWLQDGHALTPQDLIGTKIEHYIKKHHPAFVFNACHAGRQAWALTRIGGWANRLISIGAGLFLAPLWTVSDDLASQFAKVFYKHLLDGKTVAESVREARKSIKQEGDPTWLAYSVYAHPNAKITPFTK